VLALWSGLGYNRRALALQRAAAHVAEHGWPSDLTELPGVGKYTAAAVSSFAWDRDMAAVDTNVRRVITRREGDVDSCYWLANTLEHADSGDVAAQALYQRACMLGEPSGCTNRAAGMFRGKRRDPGIMRCAARTFERTCALHDAWGHFSHLGEGRANAGNGRETGGSR
jgi:A/G-specific adenine glycosylase